MNHTVEQILPGTAAASQDDRRLVRDYVRGDAEAIRAVDGWIDIVLRGEFRGVEEHWDDIRQEIRLRVLGNLRDGRFHFKSELRTYVHRIARNTAIDQWRRVAGRRARAAAGAGAGATGATGATGDSERIMSRDFLDKLILGLTPEERRLLTLVHIDCLSYVEVARELGVAVGTIKARVFRCRERLVELRRRLLAPQGR